MDNRRLFTAIILSMLVLIAWGYLFPGPEPRTSPPSPSATEEASAPEPTSPFPSGSTSSSEPTTPAEMPTPASSTPSASEAEAQTSEEKTLETSVEGAREERVVLEGERARLEFTSRGAKLVSYQLLEHTDAEGRLLDLVRRRTEGPYPFSIVDEEGEPLPLEDALFFAERSLDGQAVTFRYQGPLGSAEKSFRLADGLLDFGVRLPGREGWFVLLGPGIRNPTTEELKSRFSHTGGVYLLGDEVERPDAKKAKEPVVVPGGGLAWAGLEDSYFLSAVLPTSSIRQVVYQPMAFPFDEEAQIGFFEPLEGHSKEIRRDFGLLIEPESDQLEGRAYWGSKVFDRLAALPGGLEKSVNLGFFSFLARPMMVGLQWIHDHVVSNYGWAIVLMTFLIRLILLYPTHKSTVSMRKMQELNPRIQAIRQKYQSKLKDKQGRPNLEAQNKMNQEIMALYKSEGANPAGGCLPMILQIPVFFAFYQVLYSWVELRHAPWILWIEDLAAPDPYYALPLVMGATQFLQQRLMPATGNPMQRRIMMLMPVFFTFLFLSFPSGLVLYWLTNNVLGIIQQGGYNWWKERSEQNEERKPARATKG